jgi:hypothetical protein
MPPTRWTRLAEQLAEQDVNVLIVDSGTNLVSKVIDTEEVGGLMDGLSEVVDAGITVVLIHHTPKVGRDAAGCYAWESWPRWIVRVEKTGGARGDQVRLTYDGNENPDVPDHLSVWLPKHARPGSRFRLVERGAEHTRSQERQRSDLGLVSKIQARSDWRSQQEIADALGVSQATVSRVLKAYQYKLVGGAAVPRLEAA